MAYITFHYAIWETNHIYVNLMSFYIKLCIFTHTHTYLRSLFAAGCSITRRDPWVLALADRRNADDQTCIGRSLKLDEPMYARQSYRWLQAISYHVLLPGTSQNLAGRMEPAQLQQCAGEWTYHFWWSENCLFYTLDKQITLFQIKSQWQPMVIVGGFGGWWLSLSWNY